MSRPAILLVVVALLAALVPVVASDALLTNSKSPYVHIITLYDAEGRAIQPSRGSTTPFSMEATCARCHDVREISRGWHFNYTAEDVEHGRPGEPWILSDFRTGTQLPISYRGWIGTWRPSDLGISDMEFVREFGRQLPGGGAGRPNPHAPDWTGDKFEMDCMVCHTSPTAVYNINDRRRLAEAGQFQALFISAIGLGSAEYAEATPPGGRAADPFAAFDPAFEEEERQEIVRFIYNMNRILPGDQVYFPITRAVADTSCLQCHTSIVHQEDMTRTGWHHDADVHLAAGMSCVDCHGHGIDHNMTRGFPGESTNPFVASLTCQGCHYGVESDEGLVLAGRLGSPIPGHHGIPPIHFELLSCTACHSGPLPQETPVFFQTSMAHALGYPEFGRGNLTTPMINGPIFLQGEDGKIAPHKIVWPAYWGWESETHVTPILPKDVLAATGNVLAGRPRARENVRPLEDEEITAALRAMLRRAPEGATPVYIAAGTKRFLSGDALEVAFSDLGNPYAWPMAHNVRPAGMALGARGCQECHAADSPFLASMVRPSGPISGMVGESRLMGAMMGLDMTLQDWWARAFAGRPAFKALAVMMILLTLLGAVAASITLMGTLARRFER